MLRFCVKCFALLDEDGVCPRCGYVGRKKDWPFFTWRKEDKWPKSYVRKKEEERTINLKKLVISIVAFVLAASLVVAAIEYVPRRIDSAVFFKKMIFGAYEQDNDVSNGKEAIEWLILKNDGIRVLLISRYALDDQPYNRERGDTTWETCSLRKWLNNEFYYAAFNDSERARILTTDVVNANHSEYGTDGGNNTSDKVFLLSFDEMKAYFRMDMAGKCAPTDYAIAQGTGFWEDTENSNYTYAVEGRETRWWWLRSPGGFSDYAMHVGVGGEVDSFSSGSEVNNDDIGVRPAIWIELDAAEQNSVETTAAAAPDSSDRFKNVTVGCEIECGVCEQNDDFSDGKEPIKWLVLEKDGNKVLAVSKYVLDYRRYNKDTHNESWKTCTLRKWLNNEFYYAAFSDSEKERIVTTDAVNAGNSKFGTDEGNNTSDKVFLLSIDEVNEYFGSNEARRCAPTAYASAWRAFSKDSFSERSDRKPTDDPNTCWWWLRSSGYSYTMAAGVFSNGEVDKFGGDTKDYCGVRPAMWITIDS